jgi:hypothetical protein
VGFLFVIHVKCVWMINRLLFHGRENNSKPSVRVWLVSLALSTLTMRDVTM